MRKQNYHNKTSLRIRLDKSMAKHTLGLFTGMLLIVLAADLLYLYYFGGWTEPISWMRTQEVVALYFILVMGIIQVVVVTKELKWQRRNKEEL